MSLKITHIQRFSLHDGPGIRTTVFLKGCSITCPWCCNPENIKISSQFYFKKDDCISCEGCIAACPFNIPEKPDDLLGLEVNQILDCLQCRRCVEACPTNALGIYGENVNNDDLMKILEKDKDYYLTTNGGVTFSGGEPLLQAEEILEIIKRLKNENINVTIETSLFAPPSFLKIIENSVDLFIIDIKILNEESCENILHANLNDFKANFKEIIRKNKKYVVRFPLIKPFTFNEQNITSLITFIRECGINYLEIFNIHDFGASKYSSLGLKSKKYGLITPNEITVFMDKLENIGIKVKLLNFI